MDIFYSPYSLTPLKLVNRLSSLDKKSGVYLMAKIGNTKVFADYFPHLPLGDRSVDEFLSAFKDQKEEYDKKVLDLLLKDHQYQLQKDQSFLNHQLWTGSEPLLGPVVKYKMLHHSDTTFLDVLKSGARLRLDGNGLYTAQNFHLFLSLVPQEFHKQIEYIEDPLKGNDWSVCPFPKAQDFLESSHCDYYIYKPNCEFYPKKNAKVIFSGYLGSDLGSWHTYCELMTQGDLSIYQGIIGKGFYVEERGLFKGSYKDCFYPDLNVVKNIYQELQLRTWKPLCKI